MSDHVFAFAIGDMAKATGVSTPTIRFYESIGLLPEPVRSQARQRVYSAADVDRLTFVRRCRDFGFGIDEVRVLLAASVRSDMDCASARDMVAALCSGFYLAVDAPGSIEAGEAFAVVPGKRGLSVAEAFGAKRAKHLR